MLVSHVAGQEFSLILFENHVSAHQVFVLFCFTLKSFFLIFVLVFNSL